jgi:hypothetical protein
MFERWYPGFNTHVGCTLDDGTYIEGIVNSYSGLPEEIQDRELILQAPIKIRPPGAPEAASYNGASACISARRIVFMVVTPLRSRRGELSHAQNPAAVVEAAVVAEVAQAAAEEGGSPAGGSVRSPGPDPGSSGGPTT